MNIKQCEKYVIYLISEINRRLDNKALDDNSLIQLTLEIDKLKEDSQREGLPESIKTLIGSITSKYSVKRINRNSLLSLVFILTFGIYYYLHQLNEKSNRRDYLTHLRHNLNDILYQIRTS